MHTFQAQLDWIAGQQTKMLETLVRWSGINSYSLNQAGLEQMAHAVVEHASGLGFVPRRVELPACEVLDDNGAASRFATVPAVMFTSPALPVRTGPRVFLGIHFDTVFPAEHPFQSARMTDAQTLVGPGVLDAKSGLLVLLYGLAAYERSRAAPANAGTRQPITPGVSWTVFLTPDEELGSPCSGHFYQQAAGRFDLGLIFEPSLPGGVLASSRKGSQNYLLLVKGRAAHAGRDFHQGKNAAVHLARLIDQLDTINRLVPGVTLNIGPVRVDSPVNVVPDTAVARFNLRFETAEQFDKAQKEIDAVMQWSTHTPGFIAGLHRQTGCPAKPLTTQTRSLLELTQRLGRQLGEEIAFAATGGVCDGNRLAAAGIPVLDNLGAIGAGLHTDHEFIHTPSLTRRAGLLALLLHTIDSDPSLLAAESSSRMSLTSSTEVKP
jgi:glutamate carboxypeptidase